MPLALVYSSTPRPVLPNAPTPCESSTMIVAPSGNWSSYFRAISAILSSGAVAAHAEDAVGDDDDPLHHADVLLDPLLHVGHVQVFVDFLDLRAREADGVDDAIVVQFVAHQGRFRRK